ncbi:hypothetical protein QZH41_000264 [Actinostola sp. cb2023]|nr:hypothetical protein QZH41_000264 [Actinostola sp. cb2023]
MPSHCPRTLATMNTHRKESLKLCDVVLRIGDTHIPSHKAVLASCSSYFFAMFNGELSESRQKIVTMKDIEAGVMEALVEFSYTGNIEITVENVQTLLSTASLVQFHEVRDLCCQFLENQLDPSNCLGIRKFTEAHGCIKFLETVDKYVLEHFKSVLKSEEYALLPIELLIKVISSDDLNVLHEEEVYEAVIAWIRHDLNNRVSKLSSLIRFVRMPLVSKHYLLNRIDSDSLVRSNLTCRDMLDEAKNYHLLPDQRARFRSDRMKPRKAMMGTLFAVGGKEAGETISNTMESYKNISMFLIHKMPE